MGSTLENPDDLMSKMLRFFCQPGWSSNASCSCWATVPTSPVDEFQGVKWGRMNTSHVWFEASCDHDVADIAVMQMPVLLLLLLLLGCWWRRLCYQPCFTFAYPQPRHLQAEHHPSSIEKRSLCSQTSTSDPKKIPWQKFWWKLQQNHRNSVGFCRNWSISWHLREDFLTKRMLQSRPCWHFGSPPWPFS